MYSYDDRIRAVELYIKLGKRVGPTIRQLGYPTKNALKGWYRAHQQRLDLPVGYARREPKFSQAQKAAAVEHYFAHDQCIAATTRALGYPCRGTLTAWVREALPKAHRAVVGSVGQRSYPATFKQAGIVALCTRQESAQAVADELGVCRPTLYNWKNQLLGREAPAFMKRKNNSPSASERAELDRQLEALQREIRQPAPTQPSRSTTCSTKSRYPTLSPYPRASAPAAAKPTSCAPHTICIAGSPL